MKHLQLAGSVSELHCTGGRVRSSRRPGSTGRLPRFAWPPIACMRARGRLGAFLRRQKRAAGAAVAQVTATAQAGYGSFTYALKHGLAYVRQSQEEYEVRLREQQVKAVKFAKPASWDWR